MARSERSIDIHGFGRKYLQAAAAVERAEISDRNRHLIFGYRDACLVKSICGKVRLIRVMGALTLFARVIAKDFDTLTRQDLEELIARLLARQPAYSAETLGTYRAILRTFMTWVLVPAEFPTKHPPAMVSWLNASVKTKDRRRLERHELYTPAEIGHLIETADNPRDKALIATLWESGGRIGEPGNMQVRHLTKHQFGYLLDLCGKTGHRNVLVISSAPYLTQWLAVHPFRDDPDSPLWVYNQRTAEPRHVGYQALRTMLIRTVQAAGIKKRIYPHLFRHSRATYCVASGIMNEQQAKMYFGWAPSSRMLAIYAHLTADDGNNAILRENHLAPQEQRRDDLAPRTCPSCTMLNQPTTPYCVRCNTVLDEAKLRQDLAGRSTNNAVILQLCKLLAEKGLLDEAATQIHDAGLGEALRVLATTK
ncbi:MAG TPA: tyrosine-type recombinase/integrase [Bryobacteraceae bacterium]|jgi:integrase